MEITKHCSTIINLSSNDLNSAVPLDITILQILRRNFCGTPHANCYITDIKPPIKFYSPRMLPDSEDGSSEVFVQYVAEAVVFEEGSPYIAKLDLIDRGGLCLSNRGIYITTGDQVPHGILKLGMYLPVRITGESKYLRNAARLNAPGSIHNIYDRTKILVYKCVGGIDAVEYEILSQRLAEAESIPEPGPIGIKISRIIHPFDNQMEGDDLLRLIEEEMATSLNPTGDGPSPHNTVVYYSRPPFINYIYPHVIRSTEPISFASKHVTDFLTETRGSVLIRMLTNYIKFRRFANDLEATYNSPSIDYEPLWHHFKSIKVPLPQMPKAPPVKPAISSSVVKSVTSAARMAKEASKLAKK
jgi:hypothetical protein